MLWDTPQSTEVKSIMKTVLKGVVMATSRVSFRKFLLGMVIFTAVVMATALNRLSNHHVAWPPPSTVDDAGEEVHATVAEGLQAFEWGKAFELGKVHRTAAKVGSQHRTAVRADPGHKRAARADPGHERAARADPGHERAARADPVHKRATRADPVHKRAVHKRAGRADPGHERAARADPGHERAARADPGRETADPGHERAARADPGHERAARVDPGRETAARVDPGRETAARVDPGRETADPGHETAARADPGHAARVDLGHMTAAKVDSSHGTVNPGHVTTTRAYVTTTKVDPEHVVATEVDPGHVAAATVHGTTVAVDPGHVAAATVHGTAVAVDPGHSTVVAQMDLGQDNHGSKARVDPGLAYNNEGPPNKPLQNLEPMVLGLNYWEQAANALSNLADLQCWAKIVANISKVVEPSVTPETRDKSVFHFTQDKNYPSRFRDMFSITHWNEGMSRRSFSTLESPEYFLQHAMKDIVYVWIRYALWPTRCRPRAEVAKQKWCRFLTERGFKLIKTVCIDFTIAPSHELSEESFRDQIFEGVSRNVTVVFGVWRGIRRSYRVALNGTRCINSMRISLNNTRTPSIIPPAISYDQATSIYKPLLFPSQQVQKFVDQFTSEHLFGNRYMVVMLRTGKLQKQIISRPPGNSSCAAGIISDWREMANRMNITKTLYFSDIGKHGLVQWNSANAASFSQYVQNSLQLTMNREQVDSVLERLTSSNDSVLIALIQQELVARATCVVMVGGGGFQTLTVHRYCQLHRGRECYSYRSGNCNNTYIQHVHG